MGFRLNAWSKNGERYKYGDDHKFYGYAGFSDVKMSFTYLYSIIRKQDKYIDMALTIEEAYGNFICCGCTEEFILTDEEYKEFMSLYILELIVWKHYDNSVDGVARWMNELACIPGDKVLIWC